MTPTQKAEMERIISMVWNDGASLAGGWYLRQLSLTVGGALSAICTILEPKAEIDPSLRRPFNKEAFLKAANELKEVMEDKHHAE